MQESATEEQIQQVVEHLIEMGFSVHRSTGARQTVVAAVGATRLALTPAAGTTDADGRLREAVFRAAVAGGLVLRELRLEAASLEELFARATSADGERPA